MKWEREVTLILAVLDMTLDTQGTPDHQVVSEVLIQATLQHSLKMHFSGGTFSFDQKRT